MNEMNKNFAIFSIFILFSYFISNTVMAEEILTWEDCVKEAKKNHPDLTSAEEKIKQSEASKSIIASNYWPSADINMEEIQI